LKQKLDSASLEHLRIGQKLPLITLGPVTAYDALAMAGLSRDFHPVRILNDVAAEAGHPGLVLHPLLISGFVGHALSQMAAGYGMSGITISYLAPAYQDDTLVLDCTLAARDRSGVIVLSFEVRHSKRGALALGRARMRTPEGL